MAHRVINVRGPNGSGKTTIARMFLLMPHEPLHLANGKVAGYRIDASKAGLSSPVYLVGTYENTCGGADAINTQAEIADRVEKAHKLGHVLVEGLLMSKSGPGGECSQRLRELGAVFAFINTPLDVCIARVLKRRAEAGNDKPFDPDKTLRSAHEQCIRCAELLRAAGGYDVRDIPWESDMPRLVASWFAEAEAQ